MIRTISTYQQTDTLRQLISRQKQQLDQATKELATGLKQDVFANSGGSASKSLQLRAAMSANDAYLVSNGRLASKLSVAADVLGEVQNAASEFLTLAAAGDIAAMNRDTLKLSARDAIDRIVAQLNAAYDGESLFAGTSTNKTPLSIGTDEAGQLTVTYLGDGKDMTARLDDTTELSYGIRANEPGIASLLTKLSHVVNADLDAMDHAGFNAFRDDLVAALGQSTIDITAIQAELGNAQARVSSKISAQEEMTKIFSNAILDIEGVDAEEAAVRLEGLSVQLQSTYEVTARMSQLSFLNFI
ncbi:flagellin [Paracoccus ravus]|uniref:flagellin n=1 Tax=Paracoccus ravus TaxID=2447760 RepID=UPI00106EF1CC|nr:flagellin [Paracoccus ravus]